MQNKTQQRKKKVEEKPKVNRRKPVERVNLRKNRPNKPRAERKPTLVTAPNAPNPNLKNNIAVNALFDPTSLDLVYASWYGFLANRGLFTLSTEDNNDPQILVDGLGYLFESFVQAISSGTMGVTRAPEIALDMFAALTSKDVNFCTQGKLTFSWTGVPSWGNNPIISAAGGDWVPLVVNTDSGDYDTLASIPGANYSEQSYSTLLSKIAGLSGGAKMRIVETAKYKSQLVRDVSSFARVYVYNGLNPSLAGGYYKDVENEVTITAPLLSSFAKYSEDQVRETRVPTKLHAYSGDAAIAAGMPLHPIFVSYFNKRAPAYKIIDFEWIYFFLVSWMTQAIPKAAAMGNWSPGDTIGITVQDFRIVLRQALMNVFDSQYMVQFLGPMTFSGNDNGFVPFQVNGNSAANQIFSTMTVPELLQENLGSLRARAIRTNNTGKSKINIQTYIPILGQYIRDTAVVPQYVVDDVPYSLFLPNNQNAINLINGEIGQNQYVNLNGTHYQTAMSFWNEAVDRVKAVTTSVTSIVGDHGPMGLGALYYTSVVVTGDNPANAAPHKVLRSPWLKQIVNSGVGEIKVEVPVKGKEMTKQTSQKKVDPVRALPPASLITATQNFTTGAVIIGAEFQAFLDSIIVPTIRLDPNGNDDQLSLQTYQIETKEVLSTKATPIVNLGGGGLVARLSKLAGYCITGVGHDSGGEYDRILRMLKDNNDAGMLAGILGGLAKTFLPPDSHGIVDTVADILPF